MMRVLSVILLASGLAMGRPGWELGNAELEKYFERRVAKLEGPLKEMTGEEWKVQASARRQQLLEMLGLEPMRARTPLKPVVTGTTERAGVVVEKLHFQSSPGLYVTANLYLPSRREGKLPAILYVCGHGGVKIDGISYGNKVSYQHHGAWFARNGYACLVLDTLQLGEIEGIHHGTYRYDRWWWLARGYTSAGVEAWNCIRALDYLQSRPEVDGDRLGVTGRSGGGAYSWWIAAIDERIKAAVPVAGITSMRNHVVDGCVEGHCDCMYQLNTYGWDYEEVASLVAPRPLLISNTDKDAIFPLDGVYQVYQPVRRIYDLLGASDKLGLNIEEGPHKDTQPLRTSAFHWMNRFLKGTDRADTFEMAAVKLFEPRELKVFNELPEDEINTRIDEFFVPKARAEFPQDEAEWKAMKKDWSRALRKKCFREWPERPLEPVWREVEKKSAGGVHVRVLEVETEPEVTCWLSIAHRAGGSLRGAKKVRFDVLDDRAWAARPGDPEVPAPGECVISFCPRGIGPLRWSDDARKQVQIRRRFALLGRSLDGMRTWDILQAVRTVRMLSSAEVVISLSGDRAMAGNVLYASLFLEKPVSSLTLRGLPMGHRDGPYYLNVLRFLDLPQAVAMAAERAPTRLLGSPGDWTYPQAVADRLKWPEGQLVIHGARGD